jgi:uncharacterized membrane protein YhaH (DUF805 family)
MNFTEAITSGFQNYFNFSARAQRSAYWYWVLFAVLVSIVASLIDRIAFSRTGVSGVSALANLAILVPGIAVAVRRLHDTDRSGWWILLFLIPLIGAIILIIWFCSGGTDGANRFGPNPLAGRT